MERRKGAEKARGKWLWLWPGGAVRRVVALWVAVVVGVSGMTPGGSVAYAAQETTASENAAVATESGNGTGSASAVSGPSGNGTGSAETPAAAAAAVTAATPTVAAATGDPVSLAMESAPVADAVPGRAATESKNSVIAGIQIMPEEVYRAAVSENSAGEFGEGAPDYKDVSLRGLDPVGADSWVANQSGKIYSGGALYTVSGWKGFFGGETPPAKQEQNGYYAALRLVLPEEATEYIDYTKQDSVSPNAVIFRLREGSSRPEVKNSVATGGKISSVSSSSLKKVGNRYVKDLIMWVPGDKKTKITVDWDGATYKNGSSLSGNKCLPTEYTIDFTEVTLQKSRESMVTFGAVSKNGYDALKSGVGTGTTKPDYEKVSLSSANLTAYVLPPSKAGGAYTVSVSGGRLLKEKWAGFSKTDTKVNEGWYAALRIGLGSISSPDLPKDKTEILWVGADGKQPVLNSDGTVKNVKGLSSNDVVKDDQGEAFHVIQWIDKKSPKLTVIADWDGTGGKYGATVYELDFSDVTFGPVASEAGFRMLPKTAFDAAVGATGTLSGGKPNYTDIVWNENDRFVAGKPKENESKVTVTAPKGTLRKVYDWTDFNRSRVDQQTGWFVGMQLDIPEEVQADLKSGSISGDTVVAWVGAGPEAEKQPTLANGKVKGGKETKKSKLDGFAGSYKIELVQRVREDTKKFTVIVDWDGNNADKYSPTEYTVDLSNVKFEERKITVVKDSESSNHIKKIEWAESGNKAAKGFSEYSQPVTTVSRNGTLTLRIYADENWKPVVKLAKGATNSDNSGVKGVPNARDSSQIDYYTYVYKNTNNQDVTLTIAEEATKRKAKFNMDEAQHLRVVADKTTVSAGNNWTLTGEAGKSKTLEFRVESKEERGEERYTVDTVTAVSSNKIKKEVEGNGSYSLSMTDDYEVTVKEKLDPGKNYTLEVSSDGTAPCGWERTFGALGTDGYIEVKKGNKTEDEKKSGKAVTMEKKVDVTITPDDGWEIDLKKTKVDGGTLTSNGDGKFTVTFSEKLKSEEVKLTVGFKKKSVSVAVTVVGAENGMIKQTAGTKQGYALSFDPPTTDYSSVWVVCKNERGVDVASGSLDYAGVSTNAVGTSRTKVQLTGRVLYVTAPTSDKTTTIELYVEDEDKKPVLLGGDSTIKVVSEKQLAGKKPTAQIRYISTTEAMLALGAPKGVTDPEKGRLYYKVDVKGGKTTYIKKEAGAAAQEAKVTVKTWPAGEKTFTPADFEVTVSLVQTNAEINNNDLDSATGLLKADKTPYETSDSAATLTGKTRAPYFEDNLKLKKLTSVVYRSVGQGGTESSSNAVKLAQVQFGNDTSYVTLSTDTIRDVTKDLKEHEKLRFGVEGGVITAWATYKNGVGTKLGKHTIEVSAEVDENNVLYASKATLVVDVRAGVRTVTVNTNSATVYKAPKKTAEVKPTYTIEDTNNVLMKPSAVKWELWNADGSAPLDGYLCGQLKINEKTGAVTVDKGFVAAVDRTKNQFTVKLTVADAGGNEQNNFSGAIEITKDYLNVQSLVLVRKQNEDSDRNLQAGWVLMKEGDKGLTTKDLAGAVSACALSVPKKDVKNMKPFYTDAEWAELQRVGTVLVPAGNISFTGNVFGADSKSDSGKLENPIKPGTVKITAKALDGGKKSAAMSLAIGYPTAGRLGLAVFDAASASENKAEKAIAILDESNKEFRFCDTANTRFMVKVVERQQTDPKKPEEWVVLDYNSKPEDVRNTLLAVTGGRKTAVFTTIAGRKLNNNNDRVELVATGKETKIRLTDRSNKKAIVLDVKLVNDGFVAQGETLKATLPKNWSLSTKETRDLDMTLKLGKGDLPTGLYAKAEIDWTAVNQANWKSGKYQTLDDEVSEFKDCVAVEKDGTLKLEDIPSVDVGSYRLKVTVGTLDENGDLKASGKPATVTLKSGNPKPQRPFKANGNYTMSEKDAAVTLTGTGDLASVSSVKITRIYAANYKGQMNNFANYFDYTKTKGREGKLTFKEGADLTKIEPKDLTGWATYEVSYNDGRDPETGDVKLTIRLKSDAAAVYTAPDVTVLMPNKGEALRADVKVCVGGKQVDVYAAKVAAGDAFGKQTPTCNDGVIQLTENNPTKGSYRLELLVVPEDSRAAEIVKKNSSDKNAQIEKLGVRVKTTVHVKEATDKDLVKIGAKDLKKTLQAPGSSIYDSKSDRYWLEIPYTGAVGTMAFKENETGGAYRFEQDPKKGVIRVGVQDPSGLSSNPAKPTKAPMTVWLEIGSGSTKTKTPEQSFTLLLNKDGNFEKHKSYDEIVDDVIKARDGRIKNNLIVSANSASDANDNSGWVALETEIRKALPTNTFISLGRGTKAAAGSTGYATFMVKLKDNREEREGRLTDDKYLSELTFQLRTVNGAIGMLADTKTAVAAWTVSVNKLTADKTWISNETTAEKIVEELRKADGMKTKLGDRIKVSVVGFEKKLATDESTSVSANAGAGFVKGRIEIRDTALTKKAAGTNSETKDFTFNIARLQTLEEAKVNVWNVVSKNDVLDIDSADTQAADAEKQLKERILNEVTKQKAIKNSDITIRWSDFTVWPARAGADGFVKGTLALENDKSKNDPKKVEVDFVLTVNAPVVNDADAVAKVKESVSEGAIEKLAATTAAADMKAAVKKAANDKVKKNGYTVDYVDETGTSYAYRATAWNTPGYFVARLKVMRNGRTVNGGQFRVDHQYSATKEVLTTLESFENALQEKYSVKTADKLPNEANVRKLSVSGSDIWSSISSSMIPTTGKNQIHVKLKKVTTYDKNGNSKETSVEKKTEPTFSREGTLTVTLIVTQTERKDPKKIVAGPKEVTLTIPIRQAVVTTSKDAEYVAKYMVGTVTIGNADDTTAGIDKKKAEIKAAVESMLGVSGTTMYRVAEGLTLTIEKADKEKPGKATVGLQLQSSSDSGKSWSSYGSSITVHLDIPRLPR